MQMHRYNRHQIEMEPCTLFDHEIRVVGDHEWVEQAVNECWFSVSKTRGTWQVYSPYITISDLLGRESQTERYVAWLESIESVAERMCLGSRAIRDRHTGIKYFVIRFGSWRTVEQFVFMMGLEGYRYIPGSQARTGP